MSSAMSDKLDIEQPDALIAYLKSTGRIQSDETPTVRVLQGGVSNRTVWIKRATGEAWVLKQALEKLRVTVDWFSSPERIHHEALGLRWLNQLLPAGSVPDFVFEDHEQHVLAMQAVPEPHDNWKTLLLRGNVNPHHVEQFGTLLGTIHRSGDEHKAEVSRVFEDRTFFETLRLEPYYSYTATCAPEAAAFIESLIADTRQNRLTLVHGDYSPKNILVYRDRLILLDHEVINFGDPAFDLGFSMTHLLSKVHHVKASRQDFRAAVLFYWETYLKTLQTVDWLEPLEARAVRHTLACLLARVAGRSQLEYMDSNEKQIQRGIVVELMTDPPAHIPDLIDQFVERLPD